MKQSTKNRILDVSVRLFGLQGLSKTKVEDIVEQARISRATFYNYFHSKEEIFFCLIETEIDNIQATVEKAIVEETDPYRKIRLYIITMVVGVREMIERLNVRHDSVESLPPVPRKLIESNLRRSIGTIMEILDYGVQVGAFAVSNAEVTAHVILSALDVYINPFKLGVEPRSIEEGVDDLLRVLCFGFSTRPVGTSRQAGREGETTLAE
jgi:AcrR family transcriptional regulator